MNSLAGNGVEAIECFEHHRPDIMLMDLQMPTMDGVVSIKAICSTPYACGHDRARPRHHHALGAVRPRAGTFDASPALHERLFMEHGCL